MPGKGLFAGGKKVEKEGGHAGTVLLLFIMIQYVVFIIDELTIYCHEKLKEHNIFAEMGNHF